ncbi:MAG: hypothetical protein IT350_17550 [Deltaproteobacteria bacterium]|nr:hypothetical protein [Deltaproteobacteria bacterium]
MDWLLVALFGLPLLGGVLTSLSPGRGSRPGRLLGAAAPIATSLCVVIMAGIVYRRFFVPLGAAQLYVYYGDWFSAGSLHADFSLRMDTAAGVICLGLAFVGSAQQWVAWRRGWDERLRGALAAMLTANLLFVLSDNLIPVVAALVAMGPLSAIAHWWRVRPDTDHERHLHVLLIHGAGDAMAIIGTLLIYAALGTLSYKGIAAETLASAGPAISMRAGAALLLLGVAIRSGPGMPNAVAPLGAMVYVGWRLDALVKSVPPSVLALVCGLAAIVSMTHLAGYARAGREADLMEARAYRHVGSFFREFLDDTLLRHLTESPAKAALAAAGAVSRIGSRPTGAVAIALVALLVALAVWRQVG